MYVHVNTASTVLRGVMAEYNFQHQQACPNYDRAVGEIEDRPLILLHVKQQEINHPPAGHAVPQIPHRTAEDQRKGDAREGQRP